MLQYREDVLTQMSALALTFDDEFAVATTIIGF